jgi:phage terminase large subunit
MAANPDTLRTKLPGYARVLFERRRYTVLYGGRGSGKSHSVARALLLQAAQEPLRVLCCREIQRSIKESVHRLLTDCIKDLGLESFYTVLDTEIRGANGSLFIFSGLSNMTVDSIKSMAGITDCWVEEGQAVSDRSWQFLIPTIREKGSRFIVTMNPQLESDATSVRFLRNTPPDCLTLRVNFDMNPWFPKELEDERAYHQAAFPETYEHVWLGAHLPAVEGAVYFKEMQSMELEGRIRRVPVDPILKTHTVWDLGIADHTAIILVQVAASEIRIVDYVQDNNRALSSYVQELKAKEHNWGDDKVPHDAYHRSIQTNQSAAQVLTQLGRNPQPIENVTLEEGIKIAREVFPRVYIDEGCTALIECLKRYRWHTPQGNNGQLAVRPLHDEFSHGADSFRYLAIAAPELSNVTWSRGQLDYSIQNRSTT